MSQTARRRRPRPRPGIAHPDRPRGRGTAINEAAADVVIGGPSVTATVDSIGAVYREISPSDIEPNPRQPRQVFDEDAPAELVHSIREFGLMQPIVVREVADGGATGKRYQLVMGERRWRGLPGGRPERHPGHRPRDDRQRSAARRLAGEHPPGAVEPPWKRRPPYQQLLDEFGVTHEELAGRIGRSRPVITNMIRLLRLPIPVQRRVAAGVLSVGHARALLALEGGSEAQGRARGADRGGGPVGPRDGGGRHTGQSGDTKRRVPSGASPSRCRASRTSPSGCRRPTTPRDGQSGQAQGEDRRGSSARWTISSESWV